MNYLVNEKLQVGIPRSKNKAIFNINKVSKDVFMPWREKKLLSINPNLQAQ